MIRKTKDIITQNGANALLLGDQALVSGANFLISVLMARFLGIEEFGVYGLVMLVLLFNVSIHQAFVSTPMLSLYPQKTIKEKRLYFDGAFTQHILFLGFSILLTSVFFLLSDFVMPGWNIKQLGMEITALITTFLMHDFFRKSFFSKKDVKQAFRIDAIAYGAQIILVSAALIFDVLTLKLTLWIICLGFCLSVLFVFQTRSFPKFSITSFKLVFLESWSYSKWLVATALLQWFSGNFFILAAGSILGPVALGAIKIGQNVIGVFNVLFLTLENLVPVSASSIMKADGKKQMIKYLMGIEWKGLLVSSVLVAFLFYFSEQVLHVVYGSDFVAYAYVLKGFALLYILVFIGLPLRFALRTLRLTREIFVSYVITTLFSLGLAYPMVRHFEIQGVIAGLMLTQLIMTSWYAFTFAKQFRSVEKEIK
jgi:O-antigen/teichoic acid export membrane protein